ncbi:1,2-epoxyphenylacetyl-CoA isomerase [Mycobacterium simulans]|uniref:enoyl-CoA hydratase n=1 Tax=Mycobacterium simulans TaxID=627089 RepID=UPI001749402F|nr:enoyl-CoA hydratase [Mycobacterium simulans]SON61181.1 1,2-epoxyphenylacetyl-CoA isomerase [Mycobacterium simulans]
MSNFGSGTQTPIAGLAVTLANGVLSVTLDRPESLNSLTLPMLAGIADTMESASTDPRVKVVRLDGAGRGFSSGGAISMEALWGTGPADNYVAECNRAVRAITTLPHPVVAAVHGPTAGCGLSLALACDLVLASDTAFFTLAFTKIGLMPDGGGSALVSAAVGRIRAMRMALLHERLPAAEALACGLVSAVYPAEDFEAEVGKVIARLLAGPPLAFAKTKDAINSATLTELEPAFARESQGQAALLRSNDFIEGATAFLQRRSPSFSGS